MSATEKQIDIIIAGKNRATAAFGEVSTQLSSLQSKFVAFGAGIGAGVVGANLFQGVMEGIRKTVMTFADFESAMSRVKALTNASSDDFSALTEEAKQLGIQTVFTAQDAAEGMGFFAQAGYKVKDIMGAMAPTLDLAAAGQLKVAESADIVAKIMHGMGVGTADLGSTVDVLTKAMTTSNTNLVQLGEAMKYVGVTSKVAGIGLTETVAAIQILSNAGIQGEMAGTALRGAILALTSPEKVQVLKQLGVAVNDVSGNMRPLADIVDDFSRALDGMGSGDRIATLGKVFDHRAVAGFAEMVNVGSGKMREMTAALENAGGTASRIATTQLDNVKGKFTFLTSSVEEAMLSVGYAARPMMLTTIAAFQDMVPPVREFSIELVKLTQDALAATKPMFMSLWDVTKTVFAGIGAAAEWLAGPLAAAGAAFLDFGKMIFDAANEGFQAMGWLANVVGEELTSVMNYFGLAGDETRSLRQVWTDGFAAMGFVFMNWKDIVELYAQAVMKRFVDIGDRVRWVFGQVVPDLMTWFGNNWREIFTGLLNFTATVFENLSKNIRAAMSSIWSFISSKGATELEFTWTPLTEGFRMAFKDLPKIAKFESSELSKILGADIDANSKALLEKLGKSLDDQTINSNTWTKKIHDLFTFAGFKPPEFKFDAGGGQSQKKNDSTGQQTIAAAFSNQGIAAVLGNNRFSGIAEQFKAQNAIQSAITKAAQGVQKQIEDTHETLKKIEQKFGDGLGKIQLYQVTT
jgi:TP901 family phage tail tape measure protein